MMIEDLLLLEWETKKTIQKFSGSVPPKYFAFWVNLRAEIDWILPW